MELKCVKCGSTDIKIKYDDGKNSVGEFLKCTCNRCEYRWENATKEKMEKRNRYGDSNG